jgi:hypothetical protein
VRKVLFSLIALLVSCNIANAQSSAAALEQLRNVALDSKQIMTAAMHINDEVTISPENMSNEPFTVGYASVVPLRVGPRADGQPTAAHKQRVDAAMQTLTSVINMLKQNSDDLVQALHQANVVAASQSKLDSLINQWNSTLGYLNQDFVALQKLTSSPEYQNGAISDTCTSVHNDARDLEKIRGKISELLK